MVGPKKLVTQVLIVDDQALVREFCHWVLSSHGVEVLEAESGAEAIELYQATQPDGVLLDVMMPDMGGLEVLAALRRLDANVRVAMISGNRQMDTVRQALKLGARDYVVKPFQSGRLAEAVKRLCAPAPEPHHVAGGVA